MRLMPSLLLATAGAVVGMGVKDEVVAVLGEPRPEEDQGSREWNGQAKSMALVEFCGYWSHYDFHSKRSWWPIPRGMTVNQLALYGGAYDVLTQTPLAGDLFVQYCPVMKEFAHAGIVLDVIKKGYVSRTKPYWDLYTIEGGVDENGRTGHSETRKVNRRLYPEMGDCFLRWAALDDCDAIPLRVGRMERAAARAVS